MNKKLIMLPVMAMVLFFLSAVFLGETASAKETDTGIIDSGACGEVRYDFYDEYHNYIDFQADRSVQYRLYKDGTMVISGSGKMGNFNSWKEGSHTWYRRKELIPWYDYRDKIKKLVVEEGVTSVGSGAFYGCKNLESIQWADSIEKVGGFAFYKCSSLKEVKLPSCVKEWGESVFAECKGLKKASMDADFRFYVRYMDKDYFKYAEELPPIIWYSEGIGMFSGCTSLEEVKLPKDILVIPEYFVEGCISLKTFPVPDSVTFWGSCPPSLCKGKYVLPDSVRTLGDGAFAGCSDLEKLILPEGLVYMGRAFEGCSSLKTVKIPESVRELYQTFYNCTGLESIVIPDTVQKGLEYLVWDINGVFEGCSNLKSVVLPSNMKYIGSNLFKNCTSLKKINLPLKLKEIGDGTFSGCSSLTDIEIPNTVEEIEDYAFYGCTSLQEINIPKGVDAFYDKVFYNCKNLKSVTVQAKSFDFFGEKIFYDCKNLSSITIYAKNNGMRRKTTFDGISKGVTIYVPKGSVKRYKKWLEETGIKKIKPIQ